MFNDTPPPKKKQRTNPYQKLPPTKPKLDFETPHTIRREETRLTPTSKYRPVLLRRLVCGGHYSPRLQYSSSDKNGQS